MGTFVLGHILKANRGLHHHYVTLHYFLDWIDLEYWSFFRKQKVWCAFFIATFFHDFIKTQLTIAVSQHIHFYSNISPYHLSYVALSDIACCIAC